jgi:hypothetical protein
LITTFDYPLYKPMGLWIDDYTFLMENKYLYHTKGLLVNCETDEEYSSCSVDDYNAIYNDLLNKGFKKTSDSILYYMQDGIFKEQRYKPDIFIKMRGKGEYSIDKNYLKQIDNKLLQNIADPSIDCDEYNKYYENLKHSKFSNIIRDNNLSNLKYPCSLRPLKSSPTYWEILDQDFPPLTKNHS